ncbi:MAG: plasmid stabilization protein [Geobacteraceae bacterium GWC2_53_11]|nr:MAG: plasmid stabilization protein [Geobacteraceae bacterium GWC2_53_11]
MTYRIILAETAESDMYNIHEYVEFHDSLQHADTLLSGIEQAITSLKTLPQRGHCPPELLRLGNREYHEIHFKPYRIIYAIRAGEVIVNGVLDGRRDIQTLLQQRLLR